MTLPIVPINRPSHVGFRKGNTTLLPGTVILTDTPQGVGAARKSTVFLQPNDTVTIKIGKIGALTSPVVAEAAAKIGESARIATTVAHD